MIRGALIVLIATVAIVAIAACASDPDDDHEPDSGNGLPEGFAMDRDGSTLSYREAVDWHVTDLLSPAYIRDGSSLTLYKGGFATGPCIELSPGLYRVDAAGASFEVAVDGCLERSASWSYDLDGTVSTVSVSFAIDAADLIAQRERAQAFNRDGHERMFSELPGLVEVDETISSVAESLRSEFLRIGGDISDRQAYADFVSSFVSVAVEYPLILSGMGVDESIYGQSDYWAMPLQTLNLMQGDCEDKSVLLCALFAASGFDAAVGAVKGHGFAGVALDGFEEVSSERLKELDPDRTYLLASSVPVEGSCTGDAAAKVFYAAEATHGQVPVGYLTSGTSKFGVETALGVAGFYPYIGDRWRAEGHQPCRCGLPGDYRYAP